MEDTLHVGHLEPGGPDATRMSSVKMVVDEKASKAPKAPRCSLNPKGPHDKRKKSTMGAHYASLKSLRMWLNTGVAATISSYYKEATMG